MKLCFIFLLCIACVFAQNHQNSGNNNQPPLRPLCQDGETPGENDCIPLPPQNGNSKILSRNVALDNNQGEQRPPLRPLCQDGETPEENDCVPLPPQNGNAKILSRNVALDNNQGEQRPPIRPLCQDGETPEENDCVPLPPQNGNAKNQQRLSQNYYQESNTKVAWARKI